MDTLTLTQLAAAVAAVVTAIGATAKIRLFTNEPTITPNSVPADFTEPVGSWYDPTDTAFPKPVYGDPYLITPDTVGVTAASVQYNFATSTDNQPQTIKGYWVTNVGGTVFYHGAYLETPKTLATDLDSLIVEPAFGLRNAA